MGDVVIDFDNVSFSYGTQTEGSLRNINFKVKEGEFILLTGQSGSGKTTVKYCFYISKSTKSIFYNE